MATGVSNSSEFHCTCIARIVQRGEQKNAAATSFVLFPSSLTPG